jgi:hypothetical protein
VTEGERATATFTLRERAGARILVIEGLLKASKVPFTAELTRAG